MAAEDDAAGAADAQPAKQDWGADADDNALPPLSNMGWADDDEDELPPLDPTWANLPVPDSPKREKPPAAFKPRARPANHPELESQLLVFSSRPSLSRTQAKVLSNALASTWAAAAKDARKARRLVKHAETRRRRLDELGSGVTEGSLERSCAISCEYGWGD